MQIDRKTKLESCTHNKMQDLQDLLQELQEFAGFLLNPRTGTPAQHVSQFHYGRFACCTIKLGVGYEAKLADQCHQKFFF